MSVSPVHGSNASRASTMAKNDLMGFSLVHDLCPTTGNH